MKKNILIAAAVSAALTLGASAQAAGDDNATGNPGAGEHIATNGAGNNVAACASCHGAKGEGNASAGFPKLAGQPASYLAHQLESYADGKRKNAVMQPIAKGLSKQQIEDVAAYYSRQSPMTSNSASKAAAPGTRGEKLATLGDDRIMVQACANCHGPGGTGEPPVYPYLAGQHANYLKSALQEWKSGARNNDTSEQMSTIAKRLSDSDITALASYYAAQPAPAAAAFRKNTPHGTPGHPAKNVPGAHHNPMPVPGTGVEPGEATQGGAQGVGGGGGASGTGPSGSKDNGKGGGK